MQIHLDTVKILGVIFAPILLPRAIKFVRSARRGSAKNQPERQALPAPAARALNILFFSTAVFLILSLPIIPYGPKPNIFQLTLSRVKSPTDLLFSRLAEHRPDQTLTAEDELLRSKLGSKAGRMIYLRFGEDALVNCPFCDTDIPLTYFIYYLPFNTMIPHLLHLLILGLVTSAPIVGRQASRWRRLFVFAGACVAALEIAVVAAYDPAVHGPAAHNPLAVPRLLHNRLYYVRLVVFAVFDAVCAGLIYLSATNRMFYTPPTPAEQAERMLTTVLKTMATTAPRLHGLDVAKNAVIRDDELRRSDGAYWQSIRERERRLDDVWQEPEVTQAVKEARRERDDNGGQDKSAHGEDGEAADTNTFVDLLTAELEKE